MQHKRQKHHEIIKTMVMCRNSVPFVMHQLSYNAKRMQDGQGKESLQRTGPYLGYKWTLQAVHSGSHPLIN